VTFIGTLFGLLLVLLAAHTVGWPLTSFIPWRLRPHARQWLSPVLGLALLIIMLVPLGWFGPGFGNSWVRLALGLPLGVALLLQVSSAAWRNTLPRLAVFTLIASWPFTVQLLRFDAYDFLNDPWTYCVQSQWLQEHSFSDPIARNNEYGAQSQVFFTQLTGTRAGAQFLQAAAQSLLGLTWAHEAYPIVVCAGYTCGAFVVAFFASISGYRRARLVAWTVGLLFALTLNGFGLGALRGYFPQTIGLPLGAAGCALCGWLMSYHTILRPGTVHKFAVLIGLLLAASTYAYSEILPFLILGCATGVLYQHWTRDCLQATLRSAGIILATFLVFAGAELPRAIRALIGQSKSVVGEGIPWAPLDFVRHALGTQSGYTDGNVLLVSAPTISGIATLIVAVLAVCGLVRYRKQKFIMPLAAILAVFCLFFLHFRYRVEPPFLVGSGQSWSQYKLANWSSIFIFMLVGAGLAALPSKLQWLAIGFSAGIATTGASHAWDLADTRTTKFRSEAGCETAPFAVLTSMAQEIRRTTTSPVFLDFDASHAKSRQLLAYLLPPGTTIADWADDVFVAWMLPEAERYASRSKAHWIVQHNEALNSTLKETRIGNYVLRTQDKIEVPLKSVSGGYPMEKYNDGNLNWLRDTITFEYLLPPDAQGTVSIEAEILSLVPALEFSFSLSQGDSRYLETIEMPESHQAWTRPPKLNRTIPIHAQGERKLLVDFRTNTPPGVIGGNDQRELTFFIRNIRLWLPHQAAPRSADSP
jgi:hypothetical protein